MKQTVVGLFNKSSEAQDAVQHLVSNGFSNENVDLSLGHMNDDNKSTDFKLNDDEHESGVARFFKNLFGDNDNNEADKYHRAASKGKSIVTVHAESSDEAHRAADILDEYGAMDVDENSSDYDYNSTGAAPVGAFNETTGMAATAGSMYDTTSNMNKSSDMTSDTKDVNRAIPIIEENLEVGKRTVQTGGVRLKSRIVERPVEEDLRLRKERVYVERNTVDRAASAADFDTFKEGEMEVIERAEVPVVNKQARVVEEVSLGKDVDERTETVRDTVRKTEVDVEDIEGKSTSSSTDTTWTKDSN